MRIGSGLAAQSSSELMATHSHIPIACEVAPHVADAQLKTDATVDTQSYSDVVALRPPSPQEVKETMNSQAGSPSLNKANCVLKTQSAALKPDSSGPNESLSSDLSDFPKGQENPKWTIVRHRCAHSISSLYKVPVRKIYTEKKPSAVSLTTEQQQAVQTAAEALSQQQKLHIQHRHKKVATHQGSASF